MSNMSYCRFNNTLHDLRDCENALGEGGTGTLSEEEMRCAISLVKTCKRIAEMFDEIDTNEAIEESIRENEAQS